MRVGVSQGAWQLECQIQFASEAEGEREGEVAGKVAVLSITGTMRMSVVGG